MKKLLIIVFILFAGSAWGATTYVSQTAQGTEDGSSCANSKALSFANTGPHSAGDTIYLCDNGGTLGAINTPSAGSSGNPITWEVASGESVTVTAAGAVAILVDENYNTFQLGNGTAFTVTGSGADTSQQVHVTADSVIIDGMTIHTSNAACIQFDGSANSNLQNSTLYDCGDGSEDGLLEIAAGSTNTTVQYNEIYGSANYGIDGIQIDQSSGWLVQYNYIHDLVMTGGEGAEQALDVKGSVTSGTFRFNHIKDITDSHCVIIHTINGTLSGVDINYNLIDTCAQAGIQLFPRNGNDMNDVDIIGNIIVNTDRNALDLSSGTAGSNWYETRIYNNTLIDCGTDLGNGYALIEINGAATEFGTTGAGSNDVSNFFKNNIVDERTNTGADNRELMYDNDSSGEYVTIENNRFYDSDGTARCYYEGTWYDCNSATIGANNEIAVTTFTNRDSDFSTSENITGAANLGSSYDDGLDEDSDFTTVTSATVYTADRDLYNSGTWGKGAVVFGSEDAADPTNQGVSSSGVSF